VWKISIPDDACVRLRMVWLDVSMCVCTVCCVCCNMVVRMSCGWNLLMGLGRWGVCERYVCDGDCACGMCGKHFYTMMSAFQRACCSWFVWLYDVSM